MNDQMDDRMKGLMTGRTVLVTGGTGGIGLVTARHLASMGACVIISGREAARGAKAVETIQTGAPNTQVHFVAADLSTQGGVDHLAGRVATITPRLDVLVNNVGSMFGRRHISSDGIEMTFAVNHMAPFRLTHRLLPALRAAAPARIVVVASRAHEGIALDFSDLQSDRRYNRWRAYKRSKLCNLYFTYALARRLDPATVTVNALHPGFVATDIGVAHNFVPQIVWRIAKLAAIDVEAGARTSVFLASDPTAGAAHGSYFVDCTPKQSSRVSYDPHAAERLWTESLRLSGLPDIGSATRGP